MDNLTQIFTKVIIAAFATTGLIEYLKNFIKTEKKWIFSCIMPVISILCYLACIYLPPAVIGCILTIGTVQLDYQLIVQTFNRIVEKNIPTIETKEEN